MKSTSCNTGDCLSPLDAFLQLLVSLINWFSEDKNHVAAIWLVVLVLAFFFVYNLGKSKGSK